MLDEEYRESYFSGCRNDIDEDVLDLRTCDDAELGLPGGRHAS